MNTTIEADSVGPIYRRYPGYQGMGAETKDIGQPASVELDLTPPLWKRGVNVHNSTNLECRCGSYPTCTHVVHYAPSLRPVSYGGHFWRWSVNPEDVTCKTCIRGMESKSDRSNRIAFIEITSTNLGCDCQTWGRNRLVNAICTHVVHYTPSITSHYCGAHHIKWSANPDDITCKTCLRNLGRESAR